MRRQTVARSLACASALAWALTFAPLGQTFAQSSTGTVRGYVRDAEGNPLASANVVATEITTNFQRGTLTTQTGFFNIPGLVPGTYTLKVNSVGYAEATRPVRVGIGQSINLDFQMSVQAIAIEGIEVTGARVAETRTSEVATNVSQEQIENIPINDRNFLALALLVPGVRSDGGSITSGGQSANNINVFLDGVTFKNDMLVGGVVGQDASQGNPFPQAAVQEFRVITQQYKAEYQKATSTVVSATTKSGTNEWRGELFLFGQNNDLVEKDFIVERICSDSITRNPAYAGPACADLGKRDKLQGGLSLGGPIMRDKLFFFGTYEGNHITWGETVSPQNIEGLRSVRPDLADQYAPHAGTFNRPLRSNLYFGKLSYVPTVGSPHRIEVSTSIRDEYDIRDFGGLNSRDAAVYLQNDVNTFAGKYQFAKSSWLNEFTASFQDYEWHPRPEGDFPNAMEINYNGQRVINAGSRCCIQDWVQDRLSLRNDLTYTKAGWFGDHVFKLGGNWDFVSFDVMQTNNIRPTQRWNNVQNNYAFPYEIVAGFGEPGVKVDNQQIGFYIQDDWNPTSRLALNLGVRWDYETNEKNNDYVTRPSDLTALQNWVATLNCANPSTDPVIKSRQVLCDLDRFTTDGTRRKPFTEAFQPRLGFSYDVFGNQRTVLFGGAGIYYDRHRLGTFISEIQRGKFEQYTFRFSTNGAPVGGNPTIVWQDEYLTREGLETILANAAIAPGGELHLFANDITPPRTNQFSLGVRQAFGAYAVTANYSGVRGYDFITMMRANRTATGGLQNNNPIWSNLFYSSQNGRTWYDALMLKAEKNYTPTSRWGVQVAYTLAKAEQNVNPGDRFTNLNDVDEDNLTRYPSNGDERHHLTTNWTLGLPFDVRFSGIIDLGSGTPFSPTVGFGAGTNACTHGNMDCLAGNDFPPGETRNWWRPERHSFIIPDAWAFRNVDLRLEKKFPVRGQEIGIIAEVFNVFDYANFTGYNLNYGTYVVQNGELSIVRTTVCPVPTSAGQACPVAQVNALGRTTGVVNDLRRFGAPRRFQLGTRYTF